MPEETIDLFDGPGRGVIARPRHLLAIGITLGVIVAVFQFGWFPGVAEGPIEVFLPVLMLAIVFGLSMDYEDFLVSRIHEEWTPKQAGFVAR